MRSEIPFSGGRGGGSVRRAINRLMPSAPAKIGAVAQGSAGGAAVASSLVNINTADASALETLSGVGSATAQAIISDREQNGPFSTIEDLMRVDGIGEKKFAKLKDSICV